MYVCGITPYDATHMGHAATYVFFDLVYRAWLDEGKVVKYVQCVTDVDDPIIERVRQIHMDWQKLAFEQIEIYCQDMHSLRVLPPTEYVGVVEAMELVLNSTKKLLESDRAYYISAKTGASLLGEPIDVDAKDVYAEIRSNECFFA